MFQLKRTISTLILIAILVSAIAAQATTYYVAPNGNDSNAGTAASPFRNIQKAADVVNPGDTVLVHDGTYTDTNGDGIIVHLTRSGSTGNVITFRSINQHGAVMDGLNFTANYGWVFAQNVAYITIDGFEIKNLGLPGDAVIINNKGVTNVTIRRNHIHDIGRICSTSANAGNGMLLGQNVNTVLVEGNIIHDIGRLLVVDGCATQGQTRHDHGIYLAGVVNTTIRNNIFYHIRRGWALHIFGGTANTLLVHNNTFTLPRDAGTTAVTHIIASATIIASQFYNNIGYDSQCAMIQFDDRGFNFAIDIRNNMTWPTVVFENNGNLCKGILGNPPGVTHSGNVNETDPQFVNVGAFDFRLRSTSPAIDAGVTISSVTADYAGTSRPQGAAYDIAAFEAQGTTSSIAPPKNLRIQ